MAIIASVYVITIRKVSPKYRAMQMETDGLNIHTNEAIKNVKTIKAFSKEDLEIFKFNEINNELKKTSIKSYSISAINMPSMHLVIYATTIAILYFGGVFVINKQFNLTTVNIASFLTYLTQALGCFRMLNNALTQINRASASFERTCEILNAKPSLIFNNDSKLKILSGDLEFCNVSFKYSELAENNVLDNINLKIESGTFVGVVGQTGSGKTTLINLINRFYDVTEGKILISGNNVKDYSEHELHSKVSFCFQTSFLFKGTVMENLKFGNKYASDEEVIEACKIACCYDSIINYFDNGFETQIAEGGTNLSGGQRERICIARALITNPKILVLDDSFSALDHITENMVKENLFKYRKDITKIVISQKISAIKNADMIVVLKDGKINNVGTHEELYKKDPIYKDMCILQHEVR